MQFCGDLPLYYVILSAAKDLEVCMRVEVVLPERFFTSFRMTTHGATLYSVILSAAKDLEVCMRVDGRAV